jgi:hypothetical protein
MHATTDSEGETMALTMKIKVAEVLAEKLLKDMGQSAPLEKSFVEAVRPTIIRLFQELPEDKQALMMYFLKRNASDSTGRDLLDIKRLISDQPIFPATVDIEHLEKVKKQIQYIHGVVASTLLVSYGGLSEETIAVEG